MGKLDLEVCDRTRHEAAKTGESYYCNGCGEMHEPHEARSLAVTNLGFSDGKTTPIGTSLRTDDIRMQELLR